MNRHIKTQMRAIVVTDKYLYRLDEKFKTKKAPISIGDILAAKINDESDNQLIVLSFKNSDNDLVFYLDSRNKNVDRVPEFLANIYRIQIKSVNRSDLPSLNIFTQLNIIFYFSEPSRLDVHVSKNVRCRVEAKEKSIMVRKNAHDVQFKKDGEMICLCLPAS